MQELYLSTIDAHPIEPIIDFELEDMPAEAEFERCGCIKNFLTAFDRGQIVRLRGMLKPVAE